MTRSLTEHESLHLTHTTSDEWDAQGTLHTKGILDIEDFDQKIKKFKDKGIVERMVDWGAKIFIPASLAIIAFLGHQFAQLQEDNKTIQRFVDKAAQASGTRQEVLTNYGRRISDLVVSHNLKQSRPTDEVRKVAKGETLITLRRLYNVENEKQYAELPDNKIKQLETTLSKYDDAGELKGLLVRFLYDSDLLTRDEQIVDLSGSNITRVNLNYAPLPDINLKGAWLTWGTFLNADLRRADLSRTDLKGADFQGANLTNANLEKADLRGIVPEKTDETSTVEKTKLQGAILVGDKLNLSGACYDENTLIDWNLIDSKHKADMRDTTGEDPTVPCKDLP